MNYELRVAKPEGITWAARQAICEEWSHPPVNRLRMRDREYKAAGLSIGAVPEESLGESLL
jgi:hypothetical protein